MTHICVSRCSSQCFIPFGVPVIDVSKGRQLDWPKMLTGRWGKRVTKLKSSGDVICQHIIYATEKNQ